MPTINPNEIDPFNAPIPGEMLTAEVGARPWQRPPELTTIEQVMSFYVDRFSDPKISSTSVSLMESGVPLTSLSETLMVANVMEGKHTIDTGMLAIPFIVELFKYIGDEAGIKYIVGDEEVEEDDSILRSVAAEKAFDEFEKETGIPTRETQKESIPSNEEAIDQSSEKQTMRVEDAQPKGIMSRGEM